MARTTARNTDMTMMTTSEENMTMEIGPDIRTTVVIPTTGKKSQGVMENGEETEEITLKIDGPTDAMTGGGQRAEN